MNLLQKFRTEFARAMRNGKYEMDRGRAYFSKSRTYVGGVFGYRVDGGPLVLGNNTTVYEGLTDILAVYFLHSTQRTGFYFVPYTNNIAPDSTLTAANFNATMAEFTNYADGTRPQWTAPGAVTAQSVANSAAPARLVFGTGGGTVRGAGLATVPGKLASTGILVAAAAFDDPAILSANSKLDLEYVLTAQDA